MQLYFTPFRWSGVLCKCRYQLQSSSLELSARFEFMLFLELERHLSTAHRDAPGKGCTMTALAAEIRQQSEVRRTFTAHVKAIIEKMISNFSWRSKRSAPEDSILMLPTMVGALILARAVDNEAFSKEILREARRGLT